MKTAIVGASGYTGGELLRLLDQHPTFQPSVITANSNVGELITSIHPHLESYGDQRFSSADISLIAECDLVFLALPHGESAKIARQLKEEQLVVDLGADFRLRNSASWSKYYGGDHAGTWNYGLPELPKSREQISQSRKVANPGCYATAIALALAPLLDVIDTGDIVAVAASGTTGAGRSLKNSLLASEVAGSLSSYKFGGVHQHTPEIEESLSAISGSTVNLSFTPILAPMPRGILATVTSRLTKKVDGPALRAIFENQYSGEEFVTLLTPDQMPRTASVLGGNHAHIQCAVDTHSNRAVISIAIDNLGKGAAGQAIQNANLMAGIAENSGLQMRGIGV